MSEPTETIEFSGPNNGRWHFTQISDWIALNPDLKDGAFRLYVILRSLVMEKQDDHVRKLTHDEIAYMMVGKNGKPSTVSTVKALLRNLEEVGLIEHPDGTRMASPTGRGNPNAPLRYRLIDWPDKQSYDGWRNAFDKLDWYTQDWPESRSDIPGADYAAWLTGEGKTTPPRRARNQGEEKASPQAKENTRHRRSFSSQDSPVTSGNVSPNKPLQEVPARSSSSSAEVEDITDVAVTTATTKRKNESPEEIVIERTGCTPEEAVAVVDLIETQGDDGKPIRRIVPWVRGRTDRDLQRDLAQVRRHSAAPTVTECGIHACEMKPYGCDACAGEIKAGDPEDITRLRSHLAMAGEKARPDLARLLGAPGRPAGASFDRDPGAYYRGINKAHQDPRYAPGTGSYVDPDTVYTEDPKVVFGTSRPKRPQDLSGALAPVVTAEQIRNGTDDFRL